MFALGSILRLEGLSLSILQSHRPELGLKQKQMFSVLNGLY